MAEQFTLKGEGSLNRLTECLKKLDAEKLVIVHGRSSYTATGADKVIAQALKNYETIEFSDFSENPKIQEVQKLADLIKTKKVDVIIAIGGGSAMDVAKAAALISRLKSSDPEKVITGEEPEDTDIPLPIIAVPTTAGSGSESTPYAVVNIGKTKHSLTSPKIIPRCIILDPALLINLPAHVRASSSIDALAQAIEALWAVNATSESRRYSLEALKIFVPHIARANQNPTIASNMQMLEASNLAGRAIAIARTTAAHAVSYPITTYFGVPHGQAVGITLPSFVEFNSEISDDDCLHPQGAESVKTKIMPLIYKAFNCAGAKETAAAIINIMKQLKMATKLSELNIQGDDFEVIVKNGFNPRRVKNNPRRLEQNQLREILKNIA